MIEIAMTITRCFCMVILKRQKYQEFTVIRCKHGVGKNSSVLMIDRRTPINSMYGKIFAYELIIVAMQCRDYGDKELLRGAAGINVT